MSVFQKKSVRIIAAVCAAVLLMVAAFIVSEVAIYMRKTPALKD